MTATPTPPEPKHAGADVGYDPVNCRPAAGTLAARREWERVIGRLPAGAVLARRCTTPGCVCPAHRRPVGVADLRARFAARPPGQGTRAWFAAVAAELGVCRAVLRRVVYRFGRPQPA